MEAHAKLAFEARVGETCDVDVIATEAATDNTLLDGFDIVGFTIDGKRQMASGVGVPGRCFAASFLRSDLDPIVPGSRVTIQVRNVGAGWPFNARLQALPPDVSDPWAGH